MKHRNSPIYFVTSNHQKFASLQKLLHPIGINLQQLDYDFDERRGLDIQTIAKSFIPALKGFPGPFVKLLLDSFSYPGIIKLMQGEADRRAIFSFAVGYFDGEKDHIFVADEEGFIIDEPRGDNLHGWTELLYIYGHPSFPGRSLAELNDE